MSHLAKKELKLWSFPVREWSSEHQKISFIENEEQNIPVAIVAKKLASYTLSIGHGQKIQLTELRKN